MTTAKGSWKALERRICRALNGERTPLSGSNSQHGTSSDCINTDYPQYYFEIKLRQNFLHHSIFQTSAEKPAKKEGKIPVLITHKKNSKTGALVVLRIEDFLKLIKTNNEKKI